MSKQSYAENSINWSSIEDEIARLLAEIPHEDRKPDSPKEAPGDPVLLSYAPSITYRLIRAVLIIGGAAFVISIVSPYFAWIAASLPW
jgi:hypothetical protein